MVSVIFTFGGFALLAFAEWLAFSHARKQLPRTQTRPPFFSAVQMAGYLSAAVGLFSARLDSSASMRAIPLLDLPVVRAVGFVLFAVGGLMLIWTVFLEIPLGLKKHGIPAGKTYRHGSYAYCRHPGFWWLACFTFGLALQTPGPLMWIIFFLANACNLLLISIQDRYTFPVQFADYREYAREVPFLIPAKGRR